MRWTSLIGRAEWVAGLVSGVAARVPQAAQIVAHGGRLKSAGPRNFYEVLDVALDADGASVKTAYRALARRFHPDVNAGDAASAGRLAEINRAYETLSDPEMRAAYDRELARRRVEVRRGVLAVAATGVVTFAVTAGLVSFALRRHLAAAPQMGAPPAVVADAGGTLAQGRMPPTPLPTEDAGLDGPDDAARAAIWKTYRDPRFGFALRYPAGLFTLDAARSDANVHTFVSRDGHATLRIVAAENAAGMTPAGLRRALMKERYAGAAFKPAPRHPHWFALSGNRGDEVFLERITFSCDGKAMHGWQMLYPSSRRATYDELAKLILRNHPHGNGPATACPDPPPKSQPRRKRD